MNTVRYFCTHCGRRFKAEEKENVECPSCFWSTTVKKEEEIGEDKNRPSNRLHAPPVAPSRRLSFNWRLLVLWSTALGVLVALVWIGLPYAKKWFAGARSFIRIPQENLTIPYEERQKATIPGWDLLSEREKAVLLRRLFFSIDRPVSGEEQRVLEHRAFFKTGYSEKLPSQPWSLENFKEMIAEQGRFYQMLLPRSYRNKLSKGFEGKYVPATEAFEKGQILHARNLWIESLIFPVYADDIQKHRGVVLTMLRPFIEDTLAKVGAINTMLVEKNIRDYEQALSQSYEKLFPSFQEGNWTGASDMILNLMRKMDALENPTTISGTPPPYPASISQVDRDIQATLIDLLEPPPPAIADLGPMRRDLTAKQKVVESFLKQGVAVAQNHYWEALDKIQRGEWEEAQRKLRKIEYPLALLEDAQKKLEILEKLRKAR